LSSPQGSYFLEIEIDLSGGVHHWDENGLRDSKCEPKEIRQIHEEMIEFVKAWLEDWKGPVAKQS
jgi:hypothetical protein